jgi:transposase
MIASRRLFVLDGPINGECFKTYVEKVLVPTLAAGDLVIMDNLGSHKGKAIRRAIRSAGAKLFFLPTYSPDLNPIEQVFAKLKASRSSPQSRPDSCGIRSRQKSCGCYLLRVGQCRFLLHNADADIGQRNSERPCMAGDAGRGATSADF